MRKIFRLLTTFLVLTLILSAAPALAEETESNAWPDIVIHGEDVIMTEIGKAPASGHLLAAVYWERENIPYTHMLSIFLSQNGGRTWEVLGAYEWQLFTSNTIRDISIVSIHNAFYVQYCTGWFYYIAAYLDDGSLLTHVRTYFDESFVEMPDKAMLLTDNNYLYSVSDPDGHILILKSNDLTTWTTLTDNNCGVDRGLDACLVWNESNNNYAILASYITAGNHLKIRRYGLLTGTWELVEDWDLVQPDPDATSITGTVSSFAFCAFEHDQHSILGKWTTNGGDDWSTVLIGSGSQNNYEPTALYDGTYVGIACINRSGDFQYHAHYRRKTPSNLANLLFSSGTSFAGSPPAMKQSSMVYFDAGEHGIAFINTINGGTALYDCMNCNFVCGDANGDGEVNIGDAVFLISYVFKGGPAPVPLCAGDANGDGDVNIGDAVYLIAYVFKGGPAPVAGCCN
jgi:hypothetical protein